MATVSGRAGLFTMDDGRFFGDLRGMPYTAGKRQKSGAIRIEFGKINIPAGNSFVSTKMSINTGIMAVTTPTVVPAAIGTSGGAWGVGTSGTFVSGFLTVQVTQTGAYSGTLDGKDVNYIVIGY